MLKTSTLPQQNCENGKEFSSWSRQQKRKLLKKFLGKDFQVELLWVLLTYFQRGNKILRIISKPKYEVSSDKKHW